MSTSIVGYLMVAVGFVMSGEGYHRLRTGGDDIRLPMRLLLGGLTAVGLVIVFEGFRRLG